MCAPAFKRPGMMTSCYDNSKIDFDRMKHAERLRMPELPKSDSDEFWKKNFNEKVIKTAKR